MIERDSALSIEDLRQQVEQDLQRLQQVTLRAMQLDDFARSSQLLSAMDQLATWLKGDPETPLPVDIESLLSPEEESDNNTFELPQTPPEPHLQGLFEEAKKKILRKDYMAALADLETVSAQTRSSELKQLSQVEYERTRKVMETLVMELCARARDATQQYPEDWDLQRRAWQEVLQKDPKNREAQAALKALADRETLAAQRTKLRSLYEALNKKESFSAIESAWERAQQLQGSSEITDPEVKHELESLYKQLDAERDKFKRLAEGGASSEKVENYEKALAIYEKAFSEGKTSIPDDVTGEEVILAEALKRTRRAYAADLRKRVVDRLDWAKASLEQGAPETAVEHLSRKPDPEAEGSRPGARPLMDRVYELLAGDVSEEDKRLLKEIENLLETSQREAAAKQRAEALIGEADKLAFEERRLKLLEAQRVYSKYPDIKIKVELAETGCVQGAVQAAEQDLSAARVALQKAWLEDGTEAAAQEFTKARKYCEQAGQRAANFDMSSDVWQQQHQNIKALLKKIEEIELHHQRMLIQLRNLDKAISERNLQLAKTLLEDLETEFPKEREFSAEDNLRSRRESVTLLKDDHGQYQDAQSHFDAREYDEVVTICGRLLSSPTYGNDARKLMYRARARLWQKSAEKKYANGELADALEQYQNIETYKQEGQLPDSDLEIYTTACARIAQIQQEQTEEQNLRKRFDSVKSLRRQSVVDWDAWWKEISELRSKPPIWLEKALADEFDKGKTAWVEEALETAKNTSGAQITQAYNKLNRLHELELLPSNHSEWHRVQFEYHTRRSEDLIKGAEIADWEKAIEHATTARDIAPHEKLQAAEAHRNATIHQSVLKTASYEAAKLDADPQNAIDALRKALKEHPWLTQDAEIRTQLLDYYLNAADWEQARQQSQVMRYVEGEKTCAGGWENLVEAVRLLQETRYTESVEALLELPKAGGLSSRLTGLYEIWKGKALQKLRAAEKQQAQGVDIETVLDRIGLLDLIAQMLPQDVEASEKLRQLSDVLARLIQPLRDKADQLRLGDSLKTSLAEGEALLKQLGAVIRTLGRVEKQDLAKLLQKTEEDVKQQVEKWREADVALDELATKWKGSVGGTWEIQSLVILLERAQSSASDVEEVRDWERKISDYRSILEGSRDAKGLRQLVGDDGDFGKAWKGECFEDILQYLQKIDKLLATATTTLSEEKFVIPERFLTFFDPFLREEMKGTAALRAGVQSKQSNLLEWRNWYTRFGEKAAALEAQWAEVNTWLSDSPPCLSSAREKLEEIPTELENLRRIVGEQPLRVLSVVAKTIADRVGPKEDFSIELDRRLDEARKLKEDLESRLKATEKPLEALDNFFNRGKKNLRHKKNRERAQALIDALLNVDACNPKAAIYQEELGYWLD